MNMNELTQKSIEAIQAAQELAVANSHQTLQPEHLCLALLGQRGLKLPVAGLAFLQAFDKGRKPVRGFQQFALRIVEHRAGQVDLPDVGQLFRQQAGDGVGALGFHRFVGVAQRVVFVFYRGGHVAGQDLRRIMVERGGGHRVGAQTGPGPGTPLGDQAEGVGDQRGIRRVFAQALRPSVAHQAPAGDVLHPPQQRIEGIGFHVVSFLPVCQGGPAAAGRQYIPGWLRQIPGAV